MHLRCVGCGGGAQFQPRVALPRCPAPDLVNLGAARAWEVPPPPPSRARACSPPPAQRHRALHLCAHTMCCGAYTYNCCLLGVQPCRMVSGSLLLSRSLLLPAPSVFLFGMHSVVTTIVQTRLCSSQSGRAFRRTCGFRQTSKHRLLQLPKHYSRPGGGRAANGGSA